mmetsp:Transcript_11042/g.45841  ORF Transcript_11042/g.45841 Transcript_11042/m.45841 type:complete len:230 (+) Transcript_11042:179-868(+)
MATSQAGGRTPRRRAPRTAEARARRRRAAPHTAGGATLLDCLVRAVLAVEALARRRLLSCRRLGQERHVGRHYGAIVEVREGDETRELFERLGRHGKAGEALQPQDEVRHAHFVRAPSERVRDHLGQRPAKDPLLGVIDDSLLRAEALQHSAEGLVGVRAPLLPRVHPPRLLAGARIRPVRDRHREWLARVAYVANATVLDGLRALLRQLRVTIGTRPCALWRRPLHLP